MMSKNSFLANMRENNKRRLWVWAVSILAFVLVFPVYVALCIEKVYNSVEAIAKSYGIELANQVLYNSLIGEMQNALGFSWVIMLMTAGIALFSAIQGFSYLYSRKKIDFYMGMPVKRKKRFLIIWLNGILLYVFPYLAGLSISLIIAAGNGAVNGAVIRSAFIAFGVHLLFYLGVYHMVLLAVMLTGNIVITGCGVLVFSLYEIVVKLVLQNYKETFFRYYSYYGDDVTPVLSPFSMYAYLVDGVNRGDAGAFKYLIGLLIFGTALLVLSYLCYLKRPAEVAGRAMAFRFTEPVIKVLLVVPVALLAGSLIGNTVNFEPKSSMDGIGYVMFTILLVLVLGCAIMQVIFEFDLKGCLHKKSHIVVSAIIAAIFFMSFRYDFTGYDSYVPKPEKVESVAFIPEGSYLTKYSTYISDNGTYLSGHEYAERYMYLNNVEEVCEIADLSMENYNEVCNLIDRYQEHWSNATVIYRLKNGRKVTRQLWVNVNEERTVQLLDTIIGSGEFKEGYLPGISQNLKRMLLDEESKRKIFITYGNTVYREQMKQSDAVSFLECYCRDMEGVTFSQLKENVPISVLQINIEETVEVRRTRSWHEEIDIYPFCNESIEWLTAHGYYKDFQLNPEDVEKIQVSNYHYEISERMAEKQSTAAGVAELENVGLVGMPEATFVEYYENQPREIYGEFEIDTRVYKSYSDPADIARIADAVYPQELIMDNYRWDDGDLQDRNYVVTVYFKSNSEMNRTYGVSASYCFIEGQVPEFVEEDTAYRGNGK